MILTAVGPDHRPSVPGGLAPRPQGPPQLIFAASDSFASTGWGCFRKANAEPAERWHASGENCPDSRPPTVFKPPIFHSRDDLLSLVGVVSLACLPTIPTPPVSGGWARGEVTRPAPRWQNLHTSASCGSLANVRISTVLSGVLRPPN